MIDTPVAYWADNTLYVYGYILDHALQLIGDIAFLLMLTCAVLMALLGALLWLLFIVRGHKV